MFETDRPVDDCRKELIDSLKSTLDALQKTVNWALLAILATAAAAMYTSSNTVKLVNIEIPREITGVITFGLLCCVNFGALRHFQRLSFILRILHPNVEQAHLRIRLHPWAINPFSESDSEGYMGYVTDNLGYGLLLLQWWAGLHTGFYLVRAFAPSRTLQTVAACLAGLYLVLGLLSMYMISRLAHSVCRNPVSARIKTVVTLAAIPIGAFWIGQMFY